MLKSLLVPSLLAFATCSQLATAKDISVLAQSTEQYASEHYQQAVTDSLAQLVKYNTVAVEGVASTENPVHQAFKQELAAQAKALGLDFQDYGYVVVIGLGDSEQRLGLITHGDVQPVDPAKWAKSPFELDSSSEPGLLLGRGTEDDKGAISTALYAMKAIKDQHLVLQKRIELYVYMAEESDWAPLQAFVAKHDMPQLNITMDASYPVVTAEKGFGTIKMTFPVQEVSTDEAYLVSFNGGFFASQIPEDASVVIANADKELLADIQHRAAAQEGMKYDYVWTGNELHITALGKSTHSSEPEHGINAITHLAAILAGTRWGNNASGALVNFINDQIGLGLYGKKFGDIAYADDFMGPMTVAPTVLKQTEQGIELSINIRRPRGKTSEQLDSEIKQALAQWQQDNDVTLANIGTYIGEPFVQTDAPQIDTLLAVFSHFSGIEDAKPIAIGGGTNSRLFPAAVSFGPAMPGVVYTGHSEHEFISVKQLALNLKMYSAVMVELAAETKPEVQTIATAHQADEAAINQTLDSLHDAASKAQKERYLALFTATGVFMGTDDWERWSRPTDLDAYVSDRFKDGTGWTYQSVERHINFSADVNTAWFDEITESKKWGRFRGTGVLVRAGDSWKIAHYAMSFLVPNEVWEQVSEISRKAYTQKAKQ